MEFNLSAINKKISQKKSPSYKFQELNQQELNDILSHKLPNRNCEIVTRLAQKYEIAYLGDLVYECIRELKRQKT